MAQNIYWQNLDPEITQAIKDAMKSGVNFKQETLPATTVGQKVWTLPWAEFIVGQDLLFIVNNTATLHDDMYTITKQGANAIVTIKDGYIPVDLPIADNTLFVTMAKGVKYENGVITTILAKDVVFEPVTGLAKTNVQEAIEEVFVYAKGIINTIADSLGSPFEATMTHVELKTQLADMMTRFKTNLEAKNVTTETTDTIYDYIYRILDIDTGVMKQTEWKNVIAPFDWIITLDKERSAPDLLLTVIEKMEATATEEIYSCLFNASDRNQFSDNPLVVFTDNAHLRRGDTFQLEVDPSFPNLEKHTVDTEVAGIPPIKTMKIIEEIPVDYMKWTQPIMRGNNLPSPYRSKASSFEQSNPPWQAFSDDPHNCWQTILPNNGSIWVKLDYGSELSVETACMFILLGDATSIEAYVSNNPNDFDSDTTTGNWTKFAENVDMPPYTENKMVYLKNIGNTQHSGRYFMFLIKISGNSGFGYFLANNSALGGRYS